MLKIITLTVGELQSNCYIIHDNSDCLIIDPGDSADYITQKILDLNLKPLAIIATHGHFDHILAAQELKINFKIPFMIHKSDLFLVGRMRSSAKHFINMDPGPPPKQDHYLSPGELKIKKFELKILHTPGHTPGSVCLYFESENILFAGDLIFENRGVGRTDFNYADKHELENSIKKIKRLPKNTTVFSGHGKPFKIYQSRGSHHI